VTDHFHFFVINFYKILVKIEVSSVAALI